MTPTEETPLGYDSNGDFVLSSANMNDPVPRDIRSARVDGSVRVLPDGAFIHCNMLQGVVFEEGVQTIGEDAFSGCRALMFACFPSTLEVIMGGAFSGCKVLDSVCLPLSLKYIGSLAFDSTIIDSVDIPDIDIPITVKRIGCSAFEDCWSLSRLDLSHCTQCLSIGKEAFRRCRDLKFIHLPPSLEGSIESETFGDCSSLTHIRVPPNVAFFGFSPPSFCSRTPYNPVHGCTSLVSLELPETLTSFELLPTVDDIEDFRKCIPKCPSLVNLYLPPSQKVDPRCANESIPEDCGPGKAAYSLEDLILKLQNRFHDLPLHRICYFHSYHSVEDTICNIRDLVKANPGSVTDVDAFGMTPLHILALTQRPKVEIFQQLPEVAKLALSSKDLFGFTPLIYLSKNITVEGMEANRWLVRTVWDQRFPFLGLDRWKQELEAASLRLRIAEDGTLLNFQSFVDDFARLEFLEAISLLELVLWKIKLEENLMDLTNDESCTHRENCRVQCGSSIVIGNVLPFLGKEL